MARRYRALDADKIVDTLETLGHRIADRFPNSGLSSVCADLISVARQTSERIVYVSRPNWTLRSLLIVLVVSTLTVLAYLAAQATTLKGTDEWSEVLQGIDALFNLTVLLGGGAFFISTLETRWKRSRALAALHELRSIVHVVDMHQLTKDPSSDRAATVSTSGPQRELSHFELMRYLDYCSEMLSLTAKCAALYAERLSDAVVVDTVGDIERLTSELSSKIWQKITIVQSLEGRETPLPSAGQLYGSQTV
ncbi:hypothetical protein [Hyphomicrobium facile]|uniref:SMODS and SLOG-associating 2TM effector domain-containing protein n=1 Tax=Hyphomicrobium facile TaxID=51670 RepID=A0A1I7MTI5_9HYPH|nr:hypothetical protein [Hyphomicrobium facile]SFV25709.1 hypothetical protein SAMN04488557_0047 [Hyphomicrobium facile]